MRVFEIEREFGYLSKNAPQKLTVQELDRLRAATLFEEIGDARGGCQTFGIGRATLYRW